MFLEEAERNLSLGRYRLTCFEAQQAAELYLRALLVALTGSHPYTHDLVEPMEALEAAGVEVPGELRLYGDALSPHYTLARYPGRKPIVYDRGRGERCLEQARVIVGWVERIADP